ncbi:MAG: MBL fold metallo-hydrolase [Clostridiales bacterium]|nr:MBL fold metallo-hydrolase [Clostridiales bacterium]
MKKRRLTSIISIFTLWILLISSITGCSGALEELAWSVLTEETADTASPVSGEDLTLHFLDIGQGDCTLITQGEHAMLIDAGDNDKGTAVQAYLNYLGIEALDYFIMTHPDADHIGGADVVLYKFDCDTVLMPDRETDTRTYDDVIQTMRSRNYTPTHPRVGDTYTFGDAAFTVLSPDRSYSDNNNNSIVIHMTHGENTFLFTGDAEAEAEEDMLSAGLNVDADVLKTAHHGSHSSTTDDFLKAVSPEYAVISCGEDNRYGHPHAETLNKFRQTGVSVYRTDEQGTITAVSDGESLVWNTSPSESWQTGEADAVVYAENMFLPRQRQAMCLLP